MSSKVTGLSIVIVIALLGIGALIGWALPRITGSQRVPLMGAPDDHWVIIENLEIIEIGEQGEHFTLEPFCVDYGKKEYSKDYPLSAFTKGEQYSQSTWLFQRHGDTEACVTIWGPAEDGRGYDVEASRFVGLKLEIRYDHELIRTMPRVTAEDLYSCMPGYVWFDLVLE